MTTPTTVIVSGDDAWAGRVVEVCAGIGGNPERTRWEEAPSPGERLPAALVMDIADAGEARRRSARAWADRGCQPMSLISLQAFVGSGALRHELFDLGYRRILRRGRVPSGFHWRRLSRELRRIHEGRLWLAAWAGNVLGTRDPALLHALSVALILIPEYSTVNTWAEELNASRGRLYDLLFRTRLSPGRCFQLMRLARAVLAYEESGRSATRKEIAKAAGYRDADHLREWCRKMTGRPLSAVLAIGMEGLAALIRIP